MTPDLIVADAGPLIGLAIAGRVEKGHVQDAGLAGSGDRGVVGFAHLEGAVRRRGRKQVLRIGHGRGLGDAGEQRRGGVGTCVPTRGAH